MGLRIDAAATHGGLSGGKLPLPAFFLARLRFLKAPGLCLSKLLSFFEIADGAGCYSTARNTRGDRPCDALASGRYLVRVHQLFPACLLFSVRLPVLVRSLALGRCFPLWN